MVKRAIKIEGMSCGHCVNWIAQALERIDGVDEAKVNLEKQSAYVRYDEGLVSAQMMSDAIEKAGYTAVEFVEEEK